MAVDGVAGKAPQPQSKLYKEATTVVAKNVGSTAKATTNSKRDELKEKTNQ